MLTLALSGLAAAVLLFVVFATAGDRRADRHRARVGLAIVEGYETGIHDWVCGRPAAARPSIVSAPAWLPDLPRAERRARGWLHEDQARAWARAIGYQHADRGTLVAITPLHLDQAVEHTRAHRSSPPAPAPAAPVLDADAVRDYAATIPPQPLRSVRLPGDAS